VEANSIAPDIFLFPRHAPTEDNPQPAAHTLQSLRLPIMILDAYEVAPADYLRHVWEVCIATEVRQVKRGAPRRIRRTTILHQGLVVYTGEANA